MRARWYVLGGAVSTVAGLATVIWWLGYTRDEAVSSLEEVVNETVARLQDLAPGQFATTQPAPGNGLDSVLQSWVFEPFHSRKEILKVSIQEDGYWSWSWNPTAVEEMTLLPFGRAVIKLKGETESLRGWHYEKVVTTNKGARLTITTVWR